MPTYSFRCSKCKYADEKFTVWSEYEKFLKKTKCPKCKSKLINNILGGIGFIMNADENRRRTKRSEKSLNKTSSTAKHENKLAKDPYYEFRK